MSPLAITALVVAHLAALVAAAHVLLTKRDPRSALGWTVALVFLPVIGLVVYLIFGIGRAQSHAEQIMRRYADISRRYAVTEDQIGARALESSEAQTLARLGHKLAGLPLCGGNMLTPLHDGDAAYPEMLKAIDAAKDHVFLGSYIFNYGVVAEKFIGALVAAKDRGVDVRVLVDGVGQLYSWRKPVKILAKKGVKTALFRPLRLYPPNFSMNLRSHRKVLVADRVGFTGGMNIADGDVLKLHPGGKGHIQDVQFKCDGPIVSQLRRAFLLNWSFCTNDYTPLPALEETAQGDYDCRVIVDGPAAVGNALCELICGAINLSRKSVTIMTPYFLPPPPLMAALKSAALRGVDVRIILPGHNNLAYMVWAIDRILPPLLEAGVKVWHQAPPFAHTKLLAIDGFYSIFGSANMDPRSLYLNFELNVEVYSKEFHDKLVDYMNSTLVRGHQTTLEELKTLPFIARLRNSLIWIFSPYL